MNHLRSGLLAGLIAVGGLSASATAPSSGTIWYSIVAENGDALGYAAEMTVPCPGGRELVQSQEIVLGETGSSTNRVSSRGVVTEDKTGRPLSIVDYTQTKDSWTHIVARIGEDTADISRETPSDRRTVTVALPVGVRFDFGKQLLRTWDPAKTPRLEFENFNADAMAVQHGVIELVPGAEGEVTVLRRFYQDGQLMSVARLVLDRAHNLVSVTQPMFGTGLTIRATDKTTALAPHPPYRVLAGTMRKSPFRISAEAAKGHIRYRFSFRDGIEFPLPQTGEQRVAAGPGFVVVDICADCGPGLPADTETLADALRPTAWLQSDHPKIREIADPVAKLPLSDAAKMELLRQKTSDAIRRVDFVGHYSAVEALSRQAGDCTETAVLLAALGRAAGIPTRVANGLVYSQERYHGVSNVFMPHNWTLAWVDGKWRSFDAALDSFDSTHIAVAVGNGDEQSMVAAEQLAGLLQWDGMGEVKTRPGT
jgi:hypothetical protein